MKAPKRKIIITVKDYEQLRDQKIAIESKYNEVIKKIQKFYSEHNLLKIELANLKNRNLWQRILNKG